jgi:hypothetical protein
MRLMPLGALRGDAIKNIAAALVKAQKAFGPALKDKTNPAFRSKYADLGACIEAVQDALNSNGIALLQQTKEDDSGVTVETVFLHESGEAWSSGPLHVPAAKQDPQGYGSALTYARRYSLMAACGIAPEDDDGNAASQPRQPGRPQAANTGPAHGDTSPRARAARIVAGVAAGDAVGAAAAIASWDQKLIDEVWKHLDADTTDALNNAWPKAAA